MQIEEIEEGFAKVAMSFKQQCGQDPNWREVLNALDSNNDKQIDFDEFVTAATNRATLLTDENLMAAFRVLNSSGDGVITPDEL